MKINDFFYTDDPQVHKIGEFSIPKTWWSRPWEYAWAYQFAQPGTVVADMGAGYTYRPFSDYLAEKVGKVFALDANDKIMDRRFHWRVQPVVADMTNTEFEDDFLDDIFCISVLEELNDWRGAVDEFHRILRPYGRLVMTFDVLYDPEQPAHRLYKGMDLEKLWMHMFRNDGPTWEYVGGSAYAEPVHPEKLVHNTEFNLCCYHVALRKV